MRRVGTVTMLYLVNVFLLYYLTNYLVQNPTARPQEVPALLASVVGKLYPALSQQERKLHAQRMMDALYAARDPHLAANKSAEATHPPVLSRTMSSMLHGAGFEQLLQEQKGRYAQLRIALLTGGDVDEGARRGQQGRGQRAALGGQVPASTTFEEWLGTQTQAEQNIVLGRAKAEARAERAGQIVRGKADAEFAARHPQRAQHRRRQQRLGAWRGRPVAIALRCAGCVVLSGLGACGGRPGLRRRPPRPVWRPAWTCACTWCAGTTAPRWPTGPPAGWASPAERLIR